MIFCPNCLKDATVEHLRDSPECARVVQSLCARYRLAQRKTVTRAGGRPPEYVQCPQCNVRMTRTEWARHRCQGESKG